MSDNTTVKTIKDVDKLFSEIVVNGQTNVSDRYSPQPEQQIVRQTQVVDTPSESAVTPPAPQQTEPVEGQKVHTVDLNNVLHPLQDLDLNTETTQRVEADTALQNQIDTISSDLTAETTARQDADLNLSRTLSSVQNALVAETAQRQWDDNELQNGITAEATARCNADATLQGNINAEALARCNADEVLQCNIDAEATARCNADSTLQCNIDTETARINGIEELIPSQASCSNQLADKNFVNSSIATNTATFLGTYTSMAQIEAIQNPTNNDYVFLQTTDAQGNTIYERYKYSSEADDWLYEYTLNNSSFTAEQWATINSGLTQSSVDTDICCAVSDEATARDTAICCAVSAEATARDTAIGNAINALDVACAGGSGKYIQSVSQTDGKICATEGTIDSVVTSGSGNPVSSGAVATALSSVVVTDAVSAQYLKTEVGGVTYKVDNCGGNTLNIQGASGYSWINYYGGASVLKISTGDGTGCLGTVEASAFCGTLYGNASSASYATSAGNADTVDGYHANVSASASTIPVRDSNNHVWFGWINSANASENIGIYGDPHLVFQGDGDGFLRRTPVACVSVGYAVNAGNADTVDGMHAGDFFHYRADDINTDVFSSSMNVQGSHIDTAHNVGWSGSLYTFWTPASQSGLMFRILGGSNGANQVQMNYSIDSNRFGMNWGTVITSENIGSQSVNYANSAGSAGSATCSAHLLINGATWESNWYWSGNSGQPTWLWGSNDGVTMTVWNPSCFSVAYASSAGQTQFANFTSNLCNNYASIIDSTRYLTSRTFFWAYGTPRNSVWSDIVNFVGGWCSDSQYPLNWGMLVASNGRIYTACSLWFDSNGVDIHIDDRGNGNMQNISCNTAEGICYGIYMTITKPQYAS